MICGKPDVNATPTFEFNFRNCDEPIEFNSKMYRFVGLSAKSSYQWDIVEVDYLVRAKSFVFPVSAVPRSYSLLVKKTT